MLKFPFFLQWYLVGSGEDVKTFEEVLRANIDWDVDFQLIVVPMQRFDFIELRNLINHAVEVNEDCRYKLCIITAVFDHTEGFIDTNIGDVVVPYYRGKSYNLHERIRDMIQISDMVNKAGLTMFHWVRPNDIDLVAFAQKCFNTYNWRFRGNARLNDGTRRYLHRQSIRWHDDNATEAIKLTNMLLTTQGKNSASGILNLKKRYDQQENYLHKSWLSSQGAMHFPPELNALTPDGMWSQKPPVEEVVKRIIIKAIGLKAAFVHKVHDDFCIRKSIIKPTLAHLNIRIERRNHRGGRGMIARHQAEMNRIVEINREEARRRDEEMRRNPVVVEVRQRCENLQRFVREGVAEVAAVAEEQERSGSPSRDIQQPGPSRVLDNIMEVETAQAAGGEIREIEMEHFVVVDEVVGEETDNANADGFVARRDRSVRRKTIHNAAFNLIRTVKKAAKKVTFPIVEATEEPDVRVVLPPRFERLQSEREELTGRTIRPVVDFEAGTVRMAIKRPRNEIETSETPPEDQDKVYVNMWGDSTVADLVPEDLEWVMRRITIRTKSSPGQRFARTIDDMIEFLQEWGRELKITMVVSAGGCDMIHREEGQFRVDRRRMTRIIEGLVREKARFDNFVLANKMKLVKTIWIIPLVMDIKRYNRSPEVSPVYDLNNRLDRKLLEECRVMAEAEDEILHRWNNAREENYKNRYINPNYLIRNMEDNMRELKTLELEVFPHGEFRFASFNWSRDGFHPNQNLKEEVWKEIMNDTFFY